MKLNRRELEGRLGASAFRTVQKWLTGKDVKRKESTGAKLGRLAFRLDKKHRQRTIDNLTLAFPELTDQERYDLARRVFEHFGRITADFISSKKRTSQQVLDSVTVHGKEHLDNALADGKGLLFVSAHFGNWERMAHWLTASGYTVNVVARDANNASMNNMVQELRESAGLEVISRGNAARPILNALKRNEVVGMLPDQNSAEIFVPFFGHPCGTVKGPAVISARSGAPLIPMYCTWTSEGKYTLDIHPPLVAEEGVEDPIEGMTRAVNTSLENAIRQHPEQYLWLHNRWKSAKQRGLI